MEFIVSPENSKKRLDLFLLEQHLPLSRSQIKKLIEENRVQVNSNSSKAGYRLLSSDRISVVIPDAQDIVLNPEDIPLKILYEDDCLIVIDKPAGMVVHPAPGNYSRTLVNALLFHYRELSRIGGSLRPGIVHRLDKNTSGVLVIAKQDQAHQNLAEQFKEHRVTRKYLALIYGSIPEDAGKIDSPIGRHPIQRKKMSSRAREGKKAVTQWRVRERFNHLTFLEIIPHTGRTHQIRVHLSERGNPIVGDPVYGGRKRARTIEDSEVLVKIQRLKGLALHAGTLGFTHPGSGEYLEFFSPLPGDLEDLIRTLRKSKKSNGEHRISN
ncbi:MAG: RluA family pseudouridine synthase [Deltaproteobacteria bacterium]|nr:MAG: RluA family pseudouridine synthase [Deltaproteobacteria bacterium]